MNKRNHEKENYRLNINGDNSSKKSIRKAGQFKLEVDRSHPDTFLSGIEKGWIRKGHTKENDTDFLKYLREWREKSETKTRDYNSMEEIHMLVRNESLIDDEFLEFRQQTSFCDVGDTAYLEESVFETKTLTKDEKESEMFIKETTFSDSRLSKLSLENAEHIFKDYCTDVLKSPCSRNSQDHCYSAKLDKPKFTCAYCQNKFVNMVEFKEHIFDQHNSSVFK